MPDSFEVEKMTVKKGEIFYQSRSQGGGYGFKVIHFDTLEDLKQILKDSYDFDFFEDYGDSLYCERTTTAAGWNADKSDFEAFNAGKICLFRESLMLDYDRFYTRSTLAEESSWRQYALENAIQINA